MDTTRSGRKKFVRRGSAAVAVLLAMILLLLVVVTMVLGGAGQHDLSIRKIDGVRAFYAAEAGLNMALRELMLGEDEDGDGGVGTIATKAALPWTQFAVSQQTDGIVVTLQSRSEAGSAARVTQAVTEYVGSKPAAMIAYGKSGDNRPAYRIWDDETQFWGPEAFANSVGAAPHWVVLRGAPASEQFALGVLGSDARITVQIWNGSTWSTPFVVTNNAGIQTSRVFDMAYEQDSGRLVIVYRRGNASAVGYRTYDDEFGWSAELTTNFSNNAPLWIGLTARPASDEIVVLGSTHSPGNHTRYGMWNGTALVDTGSFATGQPLAGTEYIAAAMTDGGTGMAVYSANAQVAYRILTGSNWSNQSTLPSIGSRPYWNRLVAQPGGNQMVLGTLSANNALTTNVWNGISWTGNATMVPDSGDNDSRSFDVAYERDTGRPLIFYNADSSTLQYRTWNALAGSWSSQLNGPTAGTGPISVVAAETGLEQGHVLVTWASEDQYLHTAAWNGLSFSAPLTLGVSSSPNGMQSFMIAASQTPSSAVKVLVWNEVAP